MPSNAELIEMMIDERFDTLFWMICYDIATQLLFLLLFSIILILNGTMNIEPVNGLVMRLMFSNRKIDKMNCHEEACVNELMHLF